MKRPAHVWTVFVISLLILAGGMGWLTVKAIELDKEARRQEAMLTLDTDFQGDVRLALRRMDQYLAELIAEESAWPHFAYQAFFFPEGTAPGVKGGKPPEPVPSPLLNPSAPYVNLYFQVDAEDNWISPNCPPAHQLSWAQQNGITTEEIATNCKQLAQCLSIIHPDELMAKLPEARPQPVELAQLNQAAIETQQQDGVNQPVQRAELPQAFTQTEQSQLKEPLPQTTSLANEQVDEQAEAQPRGQQGQATQQEQQEDLQAMLAQGPPSQGRSRVLPPSQTLRNQFEFENRQRAVRGYSSKWNTRLQQRDQLYGNNDAAVNNPAINNVVEKLKGEFGDKTPQVLEGRAVPLWVGSELILARRVVIDGQTLLQGVWLDWSAIKQALIDEVQDLALTDLEIVPVQSDSNDDKGRMLAALPAQLVVAPPPIDKWIDGDTLSPIELSLIIAWTCLVLAAVAVAALLSGVLSLSERRAAFVSAVTHELRTPLTTFRMYAEMLAEDMVPEAARRRQYLNTLKSEADRLFHLVENVLSYARLERGKSGCKMTKVDVEHLIDGMQRRLAERARRDDMELVVEIDDSARGRSVKTDVAAVEQIVSNLVDNACKYAVAAGDRRIHFSARGERSAVLLRVCDHGPGIQADEKRSLFEPFTKSAREAAHSAPGVGLGLALCRRMARDIGGQFWLEPPGEDGACFVLKLPATSS